MIGRRDHRWFDYTGCVSLAFAARGQKGHRRAVRRRPVQAPEKWRQRRLSRGYQVLDRQVRCLWWIESMVKKRWSCVRTYWWNGTESAVPK